MEKVHRSIKNVFLQRCKLRYRGEIPINTPMHIDDTDIDDNTGLNEQDDADFL